LSVAPSPAVAPPPGNPRFPLFDSLRAIAALSVLTFHVAAVTGALNHGRLGDVLAMLSRGVIVFFVISGFLLYRPFVAARAAPREAPRPLAYARRRALRIVPAYWFALTVLAVFVGLVGPFDHDWWRYYLFLQSYWHDSFAAGIPVAWTLCIEVAFYVALPLWALAVGRIRLGGGRRAWLRGELVALALVALVGIVVQVAAARQRVSMEVSQSLLGQCTWFAIGMALAALSVAAEQDGGGSRADRLVSQRPGLCWLGAGASLVGLALLLHPGGLLGIAQALERKQSVGTTLASIALTGLLSGLLVLPAVFGERAGGLPRRVLAAAPLLWLGLVSYGIYLWHLPVAELLGRDRDPQHFSASGLDLATKIDHATTPIFFVITLAVTVALAAFSYYVVELPFLRRKEA
jgi:peptidoglycan/LPS O-acetylase OafA/YrhL